MKCQNFKAKGRREKSKFEAKTKPYESICVQNYITWQVFFQFRKGKKFFDHANSVDQKASEEELDTEVSRFEHVI